MLLTLLAGLALAGPYEATLDAARQALLAGDGGSAAGYLRSAEAYAPSAGYVLAGEELARLWLYRGAIAHRQGDTDTALQMWRQSLVIEVELPWEDGLSSDLAAQDLFEALRQEVRSRPRRDAQVPAQFGAAKLYLDGERLRGGEAAVEGLHLAQVECPEGGGVHGAWTDFEKRFSWLKLCPGGVDLSAAPAEEPEDEFAEFGPDFGGGAPDPALAPADPLPPLPPPRQVSKPLLAGAGGAALVSGGLYLAAYLSRSQFDDLGNAEIQSASDVDAMRQRTNTRVYLSAGAGAVAVGLYAAAFVDLSF